MQLYTWALTIGLVCVCGLIERLDTGCLALVSRIKQSENS